VAHRDLEGVHVLVVEDTDDSREMLRIALEYCGALVWTAESAARAKRILETLRPHVLVTDIAMPDDGIALIREVKTVAQTKGIHIPAIAVTAYRGRRDELLAEGFAALVEKPLDPITLCGMVRKQGSNLAPCSSSWRSIGRAATLGWVSRSPGTVAAPHRSS
jgi:CheY-like chemotaxis protein